MNVSEIMRRCQLREPATLPNGEQVVIVRPLRFLPMTIVGHGAPRAHVNQHFVRGPGN